MAKLNVQFIFHRGASRKKQKLWASAYKNIGNAAMRGLDVLLRFGMPGDMIEYIDRTSEMQIAVHKVHANGILEYIKNPDYKVQGDNAKPLPPTLLIALTSQVSVASNLHSEVSAELRDRKLLDALDQRSERQIHVH